MAEFDWGKNRPAAIGTRRRRLGSRRRIAGDTQSNATDRQLFGKKAQPNGEGTGKLTGCLSTAGEVLTATGDDNGGRRRSEVDGDPAATAERRNRRAQELPGRQAMPEKGLADRGNHRAMLATEEGGGDYRRSVRAWFRRRRDFGEQQNELLTLRRCWRRARTRRGGSGAADCSATAVAMALGELGFSCACAGGEGGAAGDI